ncbi:MAG: pyruvate dehydrogenase (acetyl-transferring) E1 component subunit alpha [Actinomycetota bacterium]|nr:pyruvate dehydrogenase (acetyl-transferring) E1 component subunit alpha [Actinomycetota bacterium]
MRGVVDPASISTEMIQMLAPDGSFVGDGDFEIDLKEEDLRQIYRHMVLARRADQEGTNLQRQGELGVYTPLLGQEAAQVGSAYALSERDWIFPSYRELAVAMYRGIDPSSVMHLFRGTVHGGDWDAREHRFAYYSVPIATQMLHAVGFARAAQIEKSNIVAITYFGDGATSEGDFHEACNYGGVWKVPVVFFCQNNQYAISVPLSKQTAAPTISAKALGYGMPGYRVDGNDVLAVYAVARETIRRAREGGGPSLIEAVTFRRGPHSTADDPTRYRTKEELAAWEAKDPIARFQTYCKNEGVLDDDFIKSCDDEGAQIATNIRASIVGAGPRPAIDLFNNVYEEMPETLRREYKQYEEEQSAREGDE